MASSFLHHRIGDSIEASFSGGVLVPLTFGMPHAYVSMSGRFSKRDNDHQLCLCQDCHTVLRDGIYDLFCLLNENSHKYSINICKILSFKELPWI